MDEKDITAIAKGIENVQDRLDNDVAGMCKLVKKLAKEIFVNRANLPKKDADSLRNHFHDIYKSFKLHLVFHSGSGLPWLGAHEKLEKLGRVIGLNAEELERQPDENSALEYSADPWSKLLEIFSSIMASEDAPAGSEKHAHDVMEIAKGWLSKKRKKDTQEETPGSKEKVQKKETEDKILNRRSIFRPKVLAIVSHNDKWSVGSSIAVSHFLRPLYLQRRIDNFKQSLKGAIVFYQPLDTAGNQNWSSRAFRTGLDVEKEKPETKPPCQCCTRMFANLVGFLKNGTFLGACAEYCPVDQLLADEALSENENQLINAALDKNREICKRYFRNFQEIDIVKESDAREKIRGSFKEHLFGLRPQCNDHFADSNRCPYKI